MINNVSFTGKTALTANGNEYQKSNKAKKIGAAAGTAFGAITGALDGPENYKQLAGYGLIGAIVCGAVALGIGALVDEFIINKNRMTQADGEAARLNKQI